MHIPPHPILSKYLECEVLGQGDFGYQATSFHFVSLLTRQEDASDEAAECYAGNFEAGLTPSPLDSM